MAESNKDNKGTDYSKKIPGSNNNAQGDDLLNAVSGINFDDVMPDNMQDEPPLPDLPDEDQEPGAPDPMTPDEVASNANNFNPDSVNPNGFSSSTTSEIVISDGDLPFGPDPDAKDTSSSASNVASSASPVSSSASPSASVASEVSSSANNSVASSEARSKARSRAVSEANAESEAASSASQASESSKRPEDSSAKSTSLNRDVDHAPKKPRFKILYFNRRQLAKLEQVTLGLNDAIQENADHLSRLTELHDQIERGQGEQLTKEEKQAFEHEFGPNQDNFIDSLDRNTVCQMLSQRINKQTEIANEMGRAEKSLTNAYGNFLRADGLDDKGPKYRTMTIATKQYHFGFNVLHDLEQKQSQDQDKSYEDRKDLLKKVGIDPDNTPFRSQLRQAQSKMSPRDFKHFRVISERQGDYWPLFGVVEKMNKTLDNEVFNFNKSNEPNVKVNANTRSKGGQAEPHVEPSTFSSSSNKHIDATQEKSAKDSVKKLPTDGQKAADDAQAGDRAKQLADAISDQQIDDLLSKMESQQKQLEDTMTQLRNVKRQRRERQLQSDTDANGDLKTRQQYKKDQKALQEMQDEVSAAQENKKRPAQDYAKAFSKTHDDLKHYSAPTLVGELSYRFGSSLVAITKTLWNYGKMMIVGGALGLRGGRHGAQMSNPLNKAARSMHEGLVSSIDSAAGSDVANKLAQERAKAQASSMQR